MVDFNFIGPEVVATSSTSGIIKLDPARNKDIAATVIAGNIAAADTVTIELIHCKSLSVGGEAEDPATVFATANRVASTTFSGSATWSLNAVIPGRYTHMRVKNDSATNTLTFTALF